MTPLSWLYMGLIWLAIVALNAYCFYRIFAKNDSAEKQRPEQ